MATENTNPSHSLINGVAIGIFIATCIIGISVYVLQLRLENEILKLENTELQKKPMMPISLSVREAIMGAGLVAQFTNQSDRHLSVVAHFRNPTTGQHTKIRLDLAPKRAKEIGHMEGWAFSSGDQISIEHHDYESVTKTIQ